MPHDCKNRLIEVGDVIRCKPYNSKSDPVCDDREYIGTVCEIHSVEQNCTGQILFSVKDVNKPDGLYLLKSDYFGAEDATILMKHDGSDPA